MGRSAGRASRAPGFSSMGISRGGQSGLRVASASVRRGPGAPASAIFAVSGCWRTVTNFWLNFYDSTRFLSIIKSPSFRLPLFFHRTPDIDKAVNFSPMADMSNSSLDLSDRLATPSPPPGVSPIEAKHYYHGLPSKPRLIARTGAPWYPPSGPEPYLPFKELRIPGQHQLLDLWEDNLALNVHEILDQNEVNWSSTDIVRIAHVGELSGNLILWIGVRPHPTSLSYDVGIDVALRCKRLLLDYHITDVDVELRESDIIQMVGPPLLKPIDISIMGFTAIQREPFTTALSITICAQHTPWAEGTAGFFLAVPGINKLFLVTTRHVLFPQSENKLIECTNESQVRHNVLLLSKSSFQQHLLSIEKEIDNQAVIITAPRLDKDAEFRVKMARARAAALRDFQLDLLVSWATDESRILGHVIYSPPIVVAAGTGHSDPQQYTQDIAVIEIDPSKINPNDFPGNLIDLGTKYRFTELTEKMHPNPRNSRNFIFPDDNLLKLWGTIPEEEMREPKMLDKNDEPCITVLKRGRSTNLTVGRATTFVSYSRKYFNENDTAVSKEWAVIPLDEKSGPFSAEGDSGSVVVDGLGRIVGMLTCGTRSGNETSDPESDVSLVTSDVTFVTPIDFIMDIIHKHKPLANAYIMSAPQFPLAHMLM